MDYLAIRRECPITIARRHAEWPTYARQLRYGHVEVSAGFAQFVQQYMVSRPEPGPSASEAHPGNPMSYIRY
ncbi:hypothetical protein [Vandammella animalimorsus]|uniref:hypothetical protein n=1 Tax=Vandammella animalimorsus TaxID=2029117 RepID=UPI001EEDD276|nr:hypothetical protein [Vandammella animalimorsus]